jgi:hypothetical protein
MWENYTQIENTWKSYEYLSKVAPHVLFCHYDKHSEIEKDKR